MREEHRLKERIAEVNSHDGNQYTQTLQDIERLSLHDVFPTDENSQVLSQKTHHTALKPEEFTNQPDVTNNDKSGAVVLDSQHLDHQNLQPQSPHGPNLIHLDTSQHQYTADTILNHSSIELPTIKEDPEEQ